MKKQIIPAAALLAVCSSAAGVPADERERNIIVEASPADLTPALTRLLADLGVSSELEIVEGQTLGEIVRRHCGRLDTNFIAMLKERSALPGVATEQITADYRFQSATRLSLPFCLRVKQKNVTVYNWVLNPETLSASGKGSGLIALGPMARKELWAEWQYTPGWSAHIDPQAWTGVDTPRTGLPYAQSYPQWSGAPASGAVKQGGVPMLAARNAASDNAEFYTVKLREGVDRDKGASLFIAQSGNHAHSENVKIRHETVLSSTNDQCLGLPPDLLPEKYPVDVYAILRVLGLNHAVNPENKEKPTPIVIGDSGLYQPRRNNWVAITQISSEFEYVPDDKYLWSQHGTYVATAALGGPYFAKYAKMLNIEIRPGNIISSEKGCEKISVASASAQRVLFDGCEVDDSKLTPLVSPAGKGGLIVNLSISHEGRLDGLEKALRDGRNKYLVVAAAGNTGKEIIPNTYPQMLPLDGQKTNVLIVSALESTGKTLAEQSSRHPSVVELAAPGCRIPVYEFSSATNSFIVKRESGTSLAAPLVSLAAALVGGQKDMSMPRVKKRLLLGADYELGLQGVVKNNAKLNIERALAILLMW